VNIGMISPVTTLGAIVTLPIVCTLVTNISLLSSIYVGSIWSMPRKRLVSPPSKALEYLCREKAVKAAIRRALEGHYQFWPVPCGYGESSLDCIACVGGIFVAIEAKRPGVNKPTPRQEAVMEKIALSGGAALLINTADPRAIREQIKEAIRSYESRRTI
jgi:hypothetical protein